MFGKIITILSSLILLTVFIFLFKFSIPPIKEYFAAKESKEFVDIKIERFLNSLSYEDGVLLKRLPCNRKIDESLCKASEKFFATLSEEKNSGVISYISIFNQRGVNVFDGTTLSPKYMPLLNKAKEVGAFSAVESTITDSSNFNLIYARNLGKNANKKSLDGLYLITMVNSSKIKENTLVIFLIIGTAFILPFLFIVLFLIKNINLSKELAHRYETENDALSQEIDTLKKENIQQSNFLANFTHELRTPLNSVIGFSGLLKDQTLGNLGNIEYVKYSEDIYNSGVHLLSLINDILDYTKADVGRLKVNIEEMDIIKVIKQCFSIVSPRASEAGVELLHSETDSHIIVKLDQKRIKQILLNLLSNAIKFTPEGGSVTVSVFPDVRGERIYIEVTDTGVGIAEKDIPLVMSLFGQADSDLNRKYEGTGIGLPFSKKLTTMMGGTFEIASKVNSGTRVTLGFAFDKKQNVEFAEIVNS